jgi:DNA-binding IscR family transcriptional regulator
MVVEAIEGPIALNLCLISGASCGRKSSCPAHPIWSQAQEAMLSVLNAATVADLAIHTTAPHTRISGVKQKTA